MRILQLNTQKELIRLMQELKVDPYGIAIMVPKAIECLVRINALSCIKANILKQEMLSLGGDVAVARGTLTGKIKKTDCLLIGSLSQYSRLSQKLYTQPFGLNQLSLELSRVIANYQMDTFTIEAGRFKLNVGPKRTCIMGIVNMTPDSFSGDGLHASSVERGIDVSERMIKDGADIIDIGGESSRPGAVKVSVKDELARTIPLIKALAKKVKVPVSIDTCKFEVARQALDNGASIVNDITALGGDSAMAGIVKKYKAAVVLMHMKGSPRSMQKDPRYLSLIDEISAYLQKAVDRAQDSGIHGNSIIIDPGIGFGKTFEHNLEILKNLREFKALGKPLLVGPSRKSFIGKLLHAKPQERLSGTMAACISAVENGAGILRVHDVKEIRQAIKVLNAVRNVGN
jgi:dihydropteroate synthase